MRIHLTAPFVAARSAWQAAYDAAPADEDFSKEASELEYAALDALLLMPAITPGEIGEKLRVMRERDVHAGWTEHHPRYMAQIERDLQDQQRPMVSPAIAAAFAVYANGRAALEALDGDASEEDADLLCLANAVAFKAMVQIPCATPGDLIAKILADWIDGGGAECVTTEVPEGTPPLVWHEIQWEPAELNSRGELYNEVAAERAILADVQNCDLGRCILTLGRTDFDAEAWIAAAHRARVPVNVIFDVEGNRSFGTGEPGEPDLTEFELDRIAMTQALLTHSKERRRAVADAIEANHPELVIRARREMAS